MVLDIRKDLLQRKQKSQPKHDLKSSVIRNPDVGPSEPAENIEGPFTPTCSYDPLLFNLHNSISREAQPRPLRVPCSACTFVPHSKQFLALSRNALRRRSQPLLTAAGANGDCPTVDEEPCAEDIAGDHRSFTVEHVASIQPIRVACSACTSSLRAPLLYGHTAVAPRVKPRKRAKRPNLSSTEALATVTTECPVQDLHDDRNRAASDCGWFVRPEQDPCMSPSNSAIVRRPSQSAATEKKKSLNVVPVEVGAVHKMERVEGHSPHESIAITYQATRSCENISEMIGEDTQLAAGEKQPYQHDCFVKRVERACAKATGSKVAGADKNRSSRYRPLSSMSRHGRRNSSANSRVGRPQQHAASSSSHGPYTAAAGLVNQTKDQGTILYDQQLVTPAGAVDHYDAVNSVIQAVSDIASISMQEKSRKENYATRHNRKEYLLSDLQKSKSASQEDQSAEVQPGISITGAAAGKKNDQKMNTCEGAEVTAIKKRSTSVNSLSKERASASQITNSDSRSQMAGSGANKEDESKEQQLRLSVEVFPSPSAPKGFGLKIVQHFPKMVEVEYVNGLGLSPRSFKTLPCQQCSSSCPPLKL